MKEVTAIGTLIFYWSLIVVGVLIGMNIIITILMGGFEKTKEVIDSAAPEWDEFVDCFAEHDDDAILSIHLYDGSALLRHFFCVRVRAF